MHPLYRKHINSLHIETELIDGGKGRLVNAIPNRKRKFVEDPKDQSSLPKKMLCKTQEQTWNDLPCSDKKACSEQNEIISMPVDLAVRERRNRGNVHPRTRGTRKPDAR
ncbi:hypothetical protein DPMN_167721 [Dreissena polymorpha]|uniref:Uncharacterized protein n=1 Tax=Dreissena polymorpha TaxID=45954 RepID=A0A9D4F1A2_DREPO|nr:hypothetical protein DPMN_167721 [Dreissena polymorpha]